MSGFQVICHLPYVMVATATSEFLFNEKERSKNLINMDFTFLVFIERISNLVIMMKC
ncbi:unnamed protein product [Meloidogyne enterolobii]|uniref:Uncharacterized protein n=1 Tax=Meloidogyne enterolobii TaxID=390850 RepID=A0ACB1AK24_MELEN